MMYGASWLVAFGAALALLGACASDKGSKGDGERDPEPPVVEQVCTEGTDCFCGPGAPRGSIVCQGNVASCFCPPCTPPLQLEEAPSVQTCDSEPFGTWRVTHAEWGRSQLALQYAGRSLGTCDLMTTNTSPEAPAGLMSLFEGGAAEYLYPSLSLQIAYSESCVTSKASILSCGSDAWTGVSDCRVDCDVCTCETSSLGSNDESSTWTRTEEGLGLQVFGKNGVFSYCATDDKLEISTKGAYVVYERVNKLSRPTACADRTPDTCLRGDSGTCQLGACVGTAGCEASTSEGQCLTTSGCSWDREQCLGTAQMTCDLADYGVVPGCELTTAPVACEGTAVACNDRKQACNAGCAIVDDGRCVGGPLQCNMFSLCPISGCGNCISGEMPCGPRDRFTCDSLNDDYEGEGCTWEQRYCDGFARECRFLEAEECNTVEGCTLVVAP